MNGSAPAVTTRSGSPATPTVPVLAVTGLEAGYGASAPSLTGLTLKVMPGKAVALLGPNGAGKTTTIRSISGLMKIHSGRVLAGKISLHGEDITHRRPHQIVRMGLAQVPEGRMIFSELTVLENLLIGASTRSDRDAVASEIGEIFGWFPQLEPRRDHQAGWLSGGEQQMLAIGRGLMAAPTLLLLDEVSLGLAPIITRAIFAQLQRVRERTGAAMLMVEQNARLALQIAHYGYVLRTGTIALEGPAADLARDPRIRDAYLGGEKTAA